MCIKLGKKFIFVFIFERPETKYDRPTCTVIFSPVSKEKNQDTQNKNYCCVGVSSFSPAYL